MKPVRGPDTVFLDSGSFHPVYVLIINSRIPFSGPFMLR